MDDITGCQNPIFKIFGTNMQQSSMNPMNNNLNQINQNSMQQGGMNPMGMGQMNQNMGNQFDPSMMNQNSNFNNPIMDQNISMNQGNMMNNPIMNQYPGNMNQMNMNMNLQNMMNQLNMNLGNMNQMNMNMNFPNMMNNQMNMNQGNMANEQMSMNQIMNIMPGNNQDIPMNQAANILNNNLSNLNIPQSNSTQTQQNNEFINVKIRAETGENNNNKGIEIQCRLDEKVSDLIEKYRSKTGDNDPTKKFIFNAKALNPDLTLEEAKVQNNAYIFVVRTKGIKGAY